MNKASNIEQGTHEWFMERLGIPTASQYGTVLSKGRGGNKSTTRENYKVLLAIERLTNKPTESITTSAMTRGQELEDPAGAKWAFKAFVKAFKDGEKNIDGVASWTATLRISGAPTYTKKVD